MSSRALALAGITRETPDPPHGRIERDANGEPSGTLREDAVGLVSKMLPERSAEEYREGLWAYEDPYIKDLTVPVLGPQRSQWLYPIGTVARTGAVLACGSDWPVRSLNPLEAIQVGVTRRDPAAGPGPAWLPDHLADRETMLACYTRNGAFANFEETETGTIETGKAADLIVLDRDPFTVPASEIAKLRVLLTLLEGKEVWREPEP